mgnify:FL=1
MARSHNNIGIVYKQKGDHEKALDYFEKSLSIWLKALGANHPEIATCYGSIANVCKAKGEYDQALGHYILMWVDSSITLVLYIRDRVIMTKLWNITINLSPSEWTHLESIIPLLLQFARILLHLMLVEQKYRHWDWDIETSMCRYTMPPSLELKQQSKILYKDQVFVCHSTASVAFWSTSNG